MTRFYLRRWRNGLITVVLTGLLMLAWKLQEMSLTDSHFLTGWILIALITILALFTVRKKIPMLPLGDANSWLQAHIYLGILTGVAFVLHLDFDWPQGVMDLWLAWLFIGVWLSGAVGLGLSRLLPKHSEAPDGREVFERIPTRRARLARDVDALVMKSAQENRSTSIVGFHAETLHAFFSKPRHLLGHLIGKRNHLQQMWRSIQSLHRYASDADRATLDALWEYIKEKDRLDRQYARQAALKLWLFAHIPLTWAMLPVIAIHAGLAYGFGAGLR